MKSLSIFLLSLFALQTAVGQDDFVAGYYISLQGDTVKGHVKVPGAKVGHCEFKAQENSSVETFSPGMVTGFGYSAADRYFQTHSLPGSGSNVEKVFAELLVRGRADLYDYGDFFYLVKDGASEKIGKVQQKQAADGGGYFYEHKIYIGTLNRFFSDCLPNKLIRGNVGYNEKDFVEVFKQYSECSGTPYYVYKTLPQPRQITYYFIGGINISKITYPEELDIFNSDKNFFFGGGIVIPLSLIGDQIFLTGELTYHHNSYRGQREGFANPGGLVMKDYLLDISIIKMPVGLKLHLSKGDVVPYLRVGVTPFFKTNVSWKIQYQGSTEENYDVKEKTPTLVPWGGAGFQAKIGSRRTLFLEVRIDQWRDFLGFYGPNGATNIPSEVSNKMLAFGVNF